MKRAAISTLVVSLFTFAGLVWAANGSDAPTVPATVALATPSDDATSCAVQQDPDFLLKPAFEQIAPTLSLCPSGFCSDDFDCRAACPAAPKATCNGFVCDYGSGGGAGSSCSSCPGVLCGDVSDCQDMCAQATSVTCVDYICIFQC